MSRVTVADKDARAVRRHLPPDTLAPTAYKAINRLTEKARRFDAALLLLIEEDVPTECRELAERIVKELRK